MEGKSSYRSSKENFSFILENIPAFKCTRCDTVLFSEETVEKVQKLVNRIERESNEIITGIPCTNLYEY